MRYVDQDGDYNNCNAYNGQLGVRPALVKRLDLLSVKLKTISSPPKENISLPNVIIRINTRLLMSGIKGIPTIHGEEYKEIKICTIGFITFQI